MSTPQYHGAIHAGAGTALALVQLSAIIPGLLPSLVLLGGFAAVLIVPLALVLAVLAAPPAGVWMLMRWLRR